MGFLYRTTTSFTGPGANNLPIATTTGTGPTGPITPTNPTVPTGPTEPTEPAFPVAGSVRRFDAATLTLTPGATVASWADSAGSGQSLAATTGTPVFQTVDGVKAVVMQSAIMEQVLSAPQPHTLTLAFKLNTSPTKVATISGSRVNSATDNALLLMNESGEAYVDAGVNWKAKREITAGWHRVVVVFNGANTSVTWNGTTTTGDAGTLPRGKFSLGGRSGASFADISVSHAAIFSRALNASEIAATDSWLKGRTA